MIANFVIALAKTTSTTTAAMASGISIRADGSSSMPTDTKNRTAKASRSGRASAAAWWLRSDSPTTAPARNAPSANETPKTVDDRNANPIAMASTASVNSSLEPSFETRVRSRGTRRVPATTMTTTKRAALPSPSATLPSVPSASVGAEDVAAEERRDRREQHEDDDRHEVLDDQPADRDPALGGVELAAVRERPQQDDRAGDRQRQPEDEPATDPPAERDAEHQAEDRRDRRSGRARPGSRSRGPRPGPAARSGCPPRTSAG